MIDHVVFRNGSFYINVMSVEIEIDSHNRSFVHSHKGFGQFFLLFVGKFVSRNACAFFDSALQFFGQAF